MLTLISSVVVNLSPNICKLCIKYIKPLWIYVWIGQIVQTAYIREASAKERGRKF